MSNAVREARAARTQIHSIVAVACPMQVLVVDRENGTADILADVICRMSDGLISTRRIQGLESALRLEHLCDYDLVLVALQENHAEPLSLLANLQAEQPSCQLLIVEQTAGSGKARLTQFGIVREVLIFPKRAVQLKGLVAHIIQTYLVCSTTRGAD